MREALAGVAAPTSHEPRPESERDGRGRLFAGEARAVMMTEIRGATNAKAKRELGWQPSDPNWRQGFAA